MDSKEGPTMVDTVVDTGTDTEKQDLVCVGESIAERLKEQLVLNGKDNKDNKDNSQATGARSKDSKSSKDRSNGAHPVSSNGAQEQELDVFRPIDYLDYTSELQMPDIMRLIQKDLSEPYSIYTYRYFIHNWPHLCFMAHVSSECVGAIVCKLDYHKKVSNRGYIAMLAVDARFRKRKIGSTLVQKAIDAMMEREADEVVLETEITNKPALRLYENLGFVRDKRLFRYYLNGVDALRLKLWLR